MEADSTITLPSPSVPSVHQKKKPFQKKVQRGGRGKPSEKKHTEEYRKRENEKFNAERIARAKERTFEGIDTELEILKKISISTTALTIQLPVSTRGIGLIAQELFAFYNRVAPRAVQATGITAEILYKVGLMQFSAQLHLAWTMHSDVLDVVKADMADTFMALDTIERVKTTTNNTLVLLSLPALLSGLFKHGDTYYLPFVPELNTISAGHPTPERSVTKRRAADTERKLPHPYRVVAQNLSGMITALADQENPVAAGVRQYFRNHCPIPGLTWNENNFVTNNPYPDNWINMFRNDALIYNAFISSIASKQQSGIGTLPLDGQGSHAALVSEYQFVDMSVGNVSDVDNKFRAPIHLDQSSMLRGGLSLLGEYPEVSGQMPAEPLCLAMRTPFSAVIHRDFNWVALLDDCNQKR